MFDCVLPTRSGRTGQAFTADGPLNLRNARFAEDQEPIEPDCPCPACTKFERAYVHHLVKSGEILGAMLMTEHNLWFYQRLMQGLRDAIAGQRLEGIRTASFLQRVTGEQPRSRRLSPLRRLLPSRRRAGSLVLGPQVEVAGVMPLVELLGGIAGQLVDDPAALDRRPRVDRLRPAHHMLIFMRREELVGAWIVRPSATPPYHGQIAMSAML